MDKIVGMVTGGKATLSQGRHDDDFADRLSSRYTPLILMVFTVIVTIGQLVRDPITCWAPVHFTDSHTKYANNYCWTKSTYFLPFEEEVPTDEEYHQVLAYYQWIQFILLTQAALFFLPTFIWRAFNSKAGVDADHILSTANDIPNIKLAEKREGNIAFLAGQIDRFLETRRTGSVGCQMDLQKCCKCCGTRIGFYLVFLYMLQKVLFIVNIFAQFAILDKLLGNKFYIYGIQVLLEPIPDHEWTTSYYVAFPRVTMCDFKVRRLGNIHRYTLQCVLPINLYIEKMYIFLWFWMVFVFVVTCFSFILWLLRFAIRKDRYNFVTNHLMDKHRLDTPEARKLADPFLDHYLRQDGAFLLRLITINTNHVTANEIIAAVWDFWCDKNGYLGYGEEDEDDDDNDDNDDDVEGKDDDIPTPSTSSIDSTGLKRRKKSPDDPEEIQMRKMPERTDTVYVRGSDTLPGNRRYPLEGRAAGIYPVVPRMSQSDISDSSSTARKPSAPPSEDSFSPPQSSDNDSFSGEKDKSSSPNSDQEPPKQRKTPESKLPRLKTPPAKPTVPTLVTPTTPSAPPLQEDPVPVTSPTPVPVTSPTPVPVTSPTPVPVTSPTPVPVTSPTPVPVTSPTVQPTAIPRPKPRPVPVTSADVHLANLPPGVPSTDL